MRPAWSWAFSPGALAPSPVDLPSQVTPEWAYGTADGSGVKVAIIDSGIDATHPSVGPIQGGVVIEASAMPENATQLRVVEGDHDDLYGHGTACAGIIRSLAPGCDLYSVRVLGRRLTGTGAAFAAGLRWAIDNDMDVVNLSLSTGRREYFPIFHRITDEAAFRNIMLVTALANIPGASYPGEFASVFSVASHADPDPTAIDRNSNPPAEWGAWGINVPVAWLGGKTVQATGNSFAAPHVAGAIARIRSAHPQLTTFQMKTVLSAIARNATTPSALS